MTDREHEGGGGSVAKPRRADPRHTLRRKVKLRCKEWSKFVELHTSNISRGGMMVLLADEPEVGSGVDVIITVPGPQEVRLEGDIVRVVPPSGGKTKFSAGIRLDVPDDKRRHLDALLEIAHAAITRQSAAELVAVGDDVDVQVDLGGLEEPEEPAEEASSDGERESVEALLSDLDAEMAELERQLDATAPPSKDEAPEAEEEELEEEEEEEDLEPAFSLIEPAPREANRAPKVSFASLHEGRNPIVGIDFGTSYSSVGIVHGEELTLITDEDGNTAIPSAVWFRGAADIVVGQEAREGLASDPAKAIYSVKRLLGAKVDDPDAGPFLASLAVPGQGGPNGEIIFDVDGQHYSPVQVAALILGHLRKLAERQLGQPVERAVLAFPLAYGERQRVAIEKAARIAGLDVVALIPEPVAAALAYGRRGAPDEHIGVYDFGGGTFDFTALSIEQGALTVRGAAGDPWLGGDDLDQALAGVAADEFWKATKIKVRNRAVEWQRLVQACEEAKCYLSMVDEIDVYVPAVAHTAEGEVDLSVPVTRKRFRKIVEDLIDTTFSVAERGLGESGLAREDLDEVLLVGGSTRVPAIRAAVERFFGCSPHATLHPEQAVVIGTALKAAETEGREVFDGTWPGLTVQQAASHSVGLAMADGETMPLIMRSTPLPAVARRIFSTFQDDQRELVLQVVEGESLESAKNRSIGNLSVVGLPPGPAGSVEVEVIFEMNESGALAVSARDLSSGRRTVTTFELL